MSFLMVASFPSGSHSRLGLVHGRKGLLQRPNRSGQVNLCGVQGIHGIAVAGVLREILDRLPLGLRQPALCLSVGKVNIIPQDLRSLFEGRELVFLFLVVHGCSFLRYCRRRP